MYIYMCVCVCARFFFINMNVHYLYFHMSGCLYRTLCEIVSICVCIFLTVSQL